MAAAIFGGEVILAATPASLFTLLLENGFVPSTGQERITFNVCTLRCPLANAGVVTIYLSSGDPVGFLLPGEAISIDTQLVRVDCNSLFLGGTPSDKVMAMCIEY